MGNICSDSQRKMSGRPYFVVVPVFFSYVPLWNRRCVWIAASWMLIYCASVYGMLSASTHRCRRWVINCGAQKLDLLTTEKLHSNYVCFWKCNCSCVYNSVAVLEHCYLAFIFELLVDCCCLQRLCSDHFEESQFTNADRVRLNWNAIPTLFVNVSQAVALSVPSSSSRRARRLSQRAHQVTGVKTYIIMKLADRTQLW